MSLNTRAIAALGAVVVIGAATVGASIAVASDQEHPSDHRATLTVGRSSIEREPLCSTDHGKAPIDTDACDQAIEAAIAKGELPTLDVTPSDQVGVGVSPDVAERGWYSFTNGGPQGKSVLASVRKDSTYSGSVSAGTVMSSGKETLVTVIERDKTSGDIYGVWYFKLNNKGV
ncbi:hypothetical protein ACWGB8_06685 [Kitasatospora sp. NPDC054939]